MVIEDLAAADLDLLTLGFVVLAFVVRFEDPPPIEKFLLEGSALPVALAPSLFFF